MSKSLEYIKSRFTTKEDLVRDGMIDKVDVNNLVEIELDGFPMKDLDSNEVLWLDYNRGKFFTFEWETEDNETYEVDLIYEPDADFEYFTSEGCWYDIEKEDEAKFNLITSCLHSILSANTSDFRKGYPENLDGSRFFYVFGNAVFYTEHLKDEMPWMEVMIPLIYNFDS